MKATAIALFMIAAVSWVQINGSEQDSGMHLEEKGKTAKMVNCKNLQISHGKGAAIWQMQTGGYATWPEFRVLGTVRWDWAGHKYSMGESNVRCMRRTMSSVVNDDRRVGCNAPGICQLESR